MPKQKAKIDIAAVEDALNCVRDIKNWIAVFADMCSLDAEPRKVLHEKVDQLAAKIGRLTCKPGHVEIDAGLVREAESSLRELRNWLYTFAQLYDIEKEAMDLLHKRFDELAEKVGHIECKPA